MNNNCRFQASWLSLLLIHDENNNNETVIDLFDVIYRYVFILVSSMGVGQRCTIIVVRVMIEI